MHIKLLFWKHKINIGSYTSKRVLLSLGSPCFFQHFFPWWNLLMMIAFITFKSSLVPLFEGLWSSNSWEFELSGLKLTRTVCHRIPLRHYTTVLFASWRGLCVVKGVESSVCIRFVNYNTGVILSQSTGAWQVSGYEMHCQHVRSIVGPSLLEQCLVNENFL